MNEYPDGGAVRADVAEPLSSVPAALPSNLPAEQSLLSAIVHVARDPQLDVAKLEALMRMQFEVEKRQADREAIEAFSRLSATLPRVKKDGVIDLGSKGKIAFTRWEDIDKVIRPLLSAEGFTLSFDTSTVEKGTIITAHLMHRSGHTRTASTPPLPLDTGPGRNQIQAMGSTISYGKRYAAEMALNIVREGEDDDGIKGAMRFATEEEVAELQALIKDTGTDEKRFCNTLNVASLDELPSPSVVIALNMLNAKKNAKKP
jgi:hypothetical protein